MIKICIPAIAILFIINSCDVPESKNSDLPLAEPAPVMHSKDCYMGTRMNDTVKISITPDGDLVTGEMTYQLAEKDKNSGTVTGHFTGDTLLLDYTFNSEGMQSVRQVVFLKTDSGLVEGYGPMADRNGTMVFADSSKVDFSRSMLLKKVECN